jgi:CubicO group peptidase (beta-lactamase class C family)
MVSTATGRSLDEYAEELLFGPIGIKDYAWKDAPEGFKDVAGGLYLKPRDLARFGLLYEREGEWDGRQIIPADWVASSGEPHVADTAPGSPNFNVGYGYQWWVFNDGSDGGVFTGWNVYDGQDYQSTWRLFYDRVVVPTANAAVGGEKIG